MTQFSVLNSIHKKGKFGNYENKNEKNLLKISEINNLAIFQLLKFKGNNLENCLKLFKLNNLTGLLLFLGIYTISI